MSFDQTKIRDVAYREKFNQKLEEIKGVRSKNTFIDYAMNQNLFDELGAIYQENLKAYRQHYQTNKRKFEKIKTVTETNKDDMHPLRYRRVERFYEEIEAALSEEDYQKNREAKKLIRQLEKHIEKAVDEYMGWREDFKEWKSRLDQVKTRIWAEAHQKFVEEYESREEFMVGNRIPQLPIQVDEKAIEEAIEKRKQAVEEVRKKVRNSISLWKKLVAIEDQYVSEKEFEKLRNSLETSIRRKKWKIGAIAATILLVLGGAGWSAPKLYKMWLHEKAWEKALSERSIEAYESYMINFPTGKYFLQAQDSIMKIPSGKISNQADTHGLSFDYEGELKGAQPHGKGIATYKDSSIYDGYWKMGIRDSFGTYVTADKHVYVGEWKNGFKEGHGKLKFPNGSIYEGNFEQDRYAGKGVFTEPGGIKYDGEWKDGFHEGKGTYTYRDGSTYTGSWKAGKYHGFGTFKSPSGVSYSGSWVNGVKQGQGTQTWTDGMIYKGGWKSGNRNGKGTLTWPNGSSFDGVWVDDTIDGQGIFISRFRDEYKGLWKGTIANIVLYDGEGNIFKQGRIEGGLFIGE
ncbi:MAG: hypothetical protein KDD99_03425 [Bacteroidetes bacterium]|nr:hypothetical protein [Bacteroidota bacterium]